MLRKKYLIVIICLFLSASLMFSGCVQKPDVTSEPEKEGDGYEADQKYLYGVCYVQGQMKDKVDINEAVSLIGALGATSVRVWNHSLAVMSDYKTVDPAKAAPYHEFYSSLKFQGVEQIVGMNHYQYLPSDPSAGTIQVPVRDMTEGSDYMKFLEMLQETWKALATEFSEIKYWEMGNEYNHDPFLNPIGYTGDGTGTPPFTLEEKADITTDMMFYASKGIKEGNPEAITIMPAMAPVDGIDGRAIMDYFERIYANIESGEFGSEDSDDFFEALAWHPYSPFKCPDQEWVDANNRIHEIAVQHGDGNKKVFLTEIGFPDGKNPKTDETHYNWVLEMFRLVKEKMPYVETVSYYRMFNDGDADLYGLFNEPNDGFSVKAKGRAFKEAAGGSGDLNKYVLDFASYVKGDNLAYRMPVSSSTSCEHPPWGWSRAGINDKDKINTGWSNYYEMGEGDWITSPTGGGANSPEKEEWISFSFPESVNIDKVLLYSRIDLNANTKKIQGLPREMYVSVSQDGENWTKVAEYKVNEDDVVVYPEETTRIETNEILEIPFDSTAAKHVKITFTKLEPDWAHQEGHYFVQLQEIEILKAD